MMPLAGFSLAIWLVLEFFRGGFWRADQRLLESGRQSYEPGVIAIIPARNEASTIGRTVASLMRQNYAGQIHVIVVDDGSDDGTADAAGDWQDLRIVSGSLLPVGWTGKLWAIHQGLTQANLHLPDAKYILMTDADIEHGPDNIAQLVNKAESENRHLVSLMVKLRAQSFWEKFPDLCEPRSYVAEQDPRFVQDCVRFNKARKATGKPKLRQRALCQDESPLFSRMSAAASP